MSDPDLSALIGSRICHDLVNPLGAIGNGVELLQMAGGDGPELTLISEAVANASQRIRLFRIAFGAALAGQGVAESEIRTLLEAGGNGGRIAIDWQPQGDQPREAVKLAFLLLLCFETALPWGGGVRISRDGGRWQVTGEAAKMKQIPDLWRLIEGIGAAAEMNPAEVQFALIAPEAARQGRRVELARSETGVSVSY